MAYFRDHLKHLWYLVRLRELENCMHTNIAMTTSLIQIFMSLSGRFTRHCCIPFTWLNQLVQHIKQHHRKVLLCSFHLNGHNLRFRGQTQMLVQFSNVCARQLQRNELKAPRRIAILLFVASNSSSFPGIHSWTLKGFLKCNPKGHSFGWFLRGVYVRCQIARVTYLFSLRFYGDFHRDFVAPL